MDICGFEASHGLPAGRGYKRFDRETEQFEHVYYCELRSKEDLTAIYLLCASNIVTRQPHSYLTETDSPLSSLITSSLRLRVSRTFTGMTPCWVCWIGVYRQTYEWEDLLLTRPCVIFESPPFVENAVDCDLMSYAYE